MKNLTVAVIEAKNAQSNAAPWLRLLDVEINDDLTKYYVRNTEPVVFNGITYEPCGFNIESIKSDTKGSLNEVQVTVSNITREVSAYVLENEMRGRRVVVTEVYQGALEIENTIRSEVYRINEISGDDKVVVFRLGHPPLLIQRFPNSRFWRNDCRFAYKISRECGFVDGTIAGAGTVNWNAGTGRIEGTGTKFGSIFMPGDGLKVKSENITIQTIISDTQLVPVDAPTDLPWSNETFYLIKPTCTNQLKGPNGCRGHFQADAGKHFGGFWGIPASMGGL